MVIQEGGEAGGLWVLLSGRLEVSKGGTRVNTIEQPGAIVGEVSLLLGSRHGATIRALEPTRARYAADGHAFLLGDPEVTRNIAVGLAERLNYVTAYLADLKFQYGDTPGLSMVDTVLTRLAHHQGAPARSGSARDPTPTTDPDGAPGRAGRSRAGQKTERFRGWCPSEVDRLGAEHRPPRRPLRAEVEHDVRGDRPDLAARVEPRSARSGPPSSRRA